MSQIYNWKRFWCTRAAQINLGDRGYLVNPESEYGHLLNPELVSLESIADLPCLILLGEPGIGKSQEMANLFKYTVEKIEPSHPPLEINLRSCNSLAIDLIQNRDFIDWNNGEHKLYLFLDSLDEGMLTVGNLATQLVDEFSKDKYRDKLHRLYVRIACRTAVFPQILEQGLKKLWEENLAIYELAPLRYIDVENAAISENIESQNFLSEVWDKTLVPLAIKPLTLGFLLNIYKRNGDRFSPEETLCNLYLEGCRLLCEENSLSRQSANQKGTLEADERLIITARIAAITVFANRFAIWMGTDRGEVPAEDVLLRQLILGNEISNGRTVEVTESAIREVIDTPLFSSRGSNRMGWAHQTYAEFLAAWYLKQHNLSTSQVLNLIIHPDNRVVPQLQETTAWLASMMPEIFQEVVRTDPDVLLQSDISKTDYDCKSKLVESLLRLHNEEKLELFRFWRYDNLHHPGLTTQLEAYIRDSSKNQGSRLVAIDIAIACKEKAIQDCLVDIALDLTQPYKIRKHSASAICRMGDESIKAQLRPLTLGAAGEDPDDDLKGYGLQAIWPHHITAIDLLNCLSQPTTIGIVGSEYQNFIATEFTKHLELSDLPRALQWLEKLPKRHYLHYPFLDLADSIMLKAWQNLNELDVLEAFASIAVLKLRRSEGIFGDRPLNWIDSSQTCDVAIEALLNDSDEKRRKLIEVIISLIPESENNLFWIKGIVCSKDILWIIERATLSESTKIANIWTEILDESLSHHNLKWKNTRHIDAILDACNIMSEMKARFKWETTPIELNSEIANRAKAGYLEDRDRLRQPVLEPLITPELKQKVITILEKVESEHPELWWQISMDMTLTSRNIYYNNSYRFNPDITIFPGWVEADTGVQMRIVEAAKTYLVAGELDPQAWIQTNKFSNTPFSGYQALYLLLKKKPEFISTISSDVWIKWMSVILKSAVFLNGSGDEICQEMVRTAYKSAPTEFIEMLVIVTTHDNNQSQTFYQRYIYEVISRMLPECIAGLVLDKIQRKDLNADLLNALLSELFDSGIEDARSIGLSFLGNVEETRDKRLVAAQMLATYADDYSWSILWPIIQQDLEFGREAFEAIASKVSYNQELKQNLNENYLADLYIFLVRQFSEIEEIEDRELKGEVFKRMGSIDYIERWQSDILQHLQSLATPEATNALQKMIVELPDRKENLQQRLIEIESLIRRKTWKYPNPEELLGIILDRDKRLVQSGEQLLDVLIESLDRLELELQGETSAGIDIWDKKFDNSNLFRPKDENAFSDYAKRFLDRDLKSRGIIANREVELRRNTGGNPGQRTDIHVDAVTRLPTGEIYDSITVIIEVKGCWHPELQTAMESQLVNRYLADNTCKYGLYLIGWFSCPQWDSQDSRNRRTPQMNIDESKIQFDRQAEMLSTSGNVVRAYVMNTALR
jgi:predicted NACHT family NTPase